MKRHPFLLIAFGILVFLTALTFYINQVVLPVVLKKTVIAQAEGFLKRKVELGGLHFNWVKGFIVDNVIIYQKDSTQVFLQAERVSLGIIWIPGFKHQRINIPFINIKNPSAHVVRHTPDQWNFSDLLVPAVEPAKPLPFSLSVAGITMTGGKVRIDDMSDGRSWSERLDQIALKVSLAYNGIPFNLSLNIPDKHGSISADGTFQPLSHEIKARIRIKNIKPSDYLVFAPSIPGFTLNNGLAENINLMVDHTKEQITVTGSAAIKNLDMALNGQSFKGDLELENVNAHRNKDSMNVTATISAPNVLAQWNGQSFKGSVNLKPLTMEFINANDITLAGSLQLDHFTATLGSEKHFKGSLTLDNIKARITSQKELSLSGKLALSEMNLALAPDFHISGSVELPSLNINLTAENINLKTQGDLNDWQMDLSQDKNVISESSFTLEADVPLKDPSQIQYSGTLTVHSAEINGYPFSPFKEITLKSDFKTDQLNIQSFSVLAMGTAIKGSAAVINFKAPVLNVEAASEQIDLAKLKMIVPKLYEQYGLSTEGNASFNVSFQGSLSDPLAGKIKASARLREASLGSTKFNQSISDVSGSIEATPDSLTWDNFTGTYLGKKYNLTGSLNNFKNPHIKTTLDGDDIGLKAELSKTGDVLSIKDLKGKYLALDFNVTGTVALPEGAEPKLDINGTLSANVEDLMPLLPPEQQKTVASIKASGKINVEASIKGPASAWKDWTTSAKITSPLLSIIGYTLNDTTVRITQSNGKLSNLTIDTLSYDGKIHAVGSGTVSNDAIPFDLALNIDGIDLHKLKSDIPNLKSEEINGKLYLTFVGKGSVADIKNLQGKGSVAIREGFLTEFKFFKGIFSLLNTVLRLGQVTITDVEGNFDVERQKVRTDNMRFKGPTIVMITDGWVDFDQNCDLKMQVDMSSGIIPPIAQDVLRSLEIHINGKISAPKTTHKISQMQVINSIIKTIGIFQ